MGKCVTKILSSNEVSKLREETILLLQNVGVIISHEEAKKMLEEAGAEVNQQTDLVKIPAKLSEDCLAKLPKTIVYGARNPEKDIVIGPGNEKVYTRSISGAELYYDLYDGKCRKARIADVKDWAILIDALDNLHECTAPYFTEEGFNLQARDVRALEILLENSTKHIVMQAYGPKNLEYCINLALAERGSEKELKKRPRFSIHVSPVPPLHYHANSVSQILMAGKYGIPIEICTMPFMGISSPITLAGGVLMALAEHLAAVVILQVSTPGAPIMIAPRCAPVNMVRGTASLGAVEHAITSAALVQIAKEGFGWQINTIIQTDSFVADAQTIMERSFLAILNASAGVDTMSGAGQCGSGNTLDPALLIIDDDLFGMMFRMKRGIEINNDTLGLEVIKRVGIGSGKSYLSDPHTLKYFKSEYFRPKIATSTSRDAWEADGRKDLYQKARERAIKILKEYQTPVLKESIIGDLRSIMVSAEREIITTTTV